MQRDALASSKRTIVLLHGAFQDGKPTWSGDGESLMSLAMAPPYLQEQMMSHVKLVKVTKIDAGHASCITKPALVAAAILEAAGGEIAQ